MCFVRGQDSSDLFVFWESARLVSNTPGRHRKNSVQAQGARTMPNAVALFPVARVFAGPLVPGLLVAEASSCPFPCLARRLQSVRILLTSGWPFGCR